MVLYCCEKTLDDYVRQHKKGLRFRESKIAALWYKDFVWAEREFVNAYSLNGKFFRAYVDLLNLYVEDPCDLPGPELMDTFLLIRDKALQTVAALAVFDELVQQTPPPPVNAADHFSYEIVKDKKLYLRRAFSEFCLPQFEQHDADICRDYGVSEILEMTC